jgi:hypothetical protein
MKLDQEKLMKLLLTSEDTLRGMKDSELRALVLDQTDMLAVLVANNNSHSAISDGAKDALMKAEYDLLAKKVQYESVTNSLVETVRTVCDATGTNPASIHGPSDLESALSILVAESKLTPGLKAGNRMLLAEKIALQGKVVELEKRIGELQAEIKTFRSEQEK